MGSRTQLDKRAAAGVARKRQQHRQEREVLPVLRLAVVQCAGGCLLPHVYSRVDARGSRVAQGGPLSYSAERR
eukprot:6604493-Prymnesium_polylepis.1